MADGIFNRNLLVQRPIHYGPTVGHTLRGLRAAARYTAENYYRHTMTRFNADGESRCKNCGATMQVGSGLSGTALEQACISAERGE